MAHSQEVSDSARQHSARAIWDAQSWEWDSFTLTAQPAGIASEGSHKKKHIEEFAPPPQTSELGMSQKDNNRPKENTVGDGGKEVSERRPAENQCSSLEDCPNFKAGRTPCACTDGEEEAQPLKRFRTNLGDQQYGGNVPKCQVIGCIADISGIKEYHQRHRVCEEHARAVMVLHNEKEQRYCQQCGRFHVLADFDEGKRSCRRKLERHNTRRRHKNKEKGQDGVKECKEADTPTSDDDEISLTTTSADGYSLKKGKQSRITRKERKHGTTSTSTKHASQKKAKEKPSQGSLTPRRHPSFKARKDQEEDESVENDDVCIRSKSVSSKKAHHGKNKVTPREASVSIVDTDKDKEDSPLRARELQTPDDGQGVAAEGPGSGRGVITQTGDSQATFNNLQRQARGQSGNSLALDPSHEPTMLNTWEPQAQAQSSFYQMASSQGFPIAEGPCSCHLPGLQNCPVAARRSFSTLSSPQPGHSRQMSPALQMLFPTQPQTLEGEATSSPVPHEGRAASSYADPPPFSDPGMSAAECVEMTGKGDTRSLMSLLFEGNDADGGRAESSVGRGQSSGRHQHQHQHSHHHSHRHSSRHLHQYPPQQEQQLEQKLPHQHQHLNATNDHGPHMWQGVQPTVAESQMMPQLQLQHHQPPQMAGQGTPGQPPPLWYAHQQFPGHHGPAPPHYSSSNPTGRMSFKLYDWNPGDFPRHLRHQILEWLAQMPTDLEGYIRPGCTHLSLFVAMPSHAWRKLDDDLEGSLESLVQGLGQPFWGRGRMLVQYRMKQAFVKDGKVEETVQLSRRDGPVLASVRPLCLVAGEEAPTVTVKGWNLSQEGSRLICSFGGRHILNSAVVRARHSHLEQEPDIVGHCLGCSGSQDSSYLPLEHESEAAMLQVEGKEDKDEREEEEEEDRIDTRAKFPSDWEEVSAQLPPMGTGRLGSVFVEVEQPPSCSNYLPMLVASPEICQEVQELEAELDKAVFVAQRGPARCCDHICCVSKNLAMQAALDQSLHEKKNEVNALLEDLGWALQLAQSDGAHQMSPCSEVQPLFQAHLTRLQGLLSYSVARGWTAVTSALLERLQCLAAGTEALQLAAEAYACQSSRTLPAGAGRGPRGLRSRDMGRLRRDECPLLFHATLSRNLPMVEVLVRYSFARAIIGQHRLAARTGVCPGAGAAARQGATALHLVAMQPQAESLLEGLLKGCSQEDLLAWFSSEDPDGCTPLDYARAAGHASYTELVACKLLSSLSIEEDSVGHEVVEMATAAQDKGLLEMQLCSSQLRIGGLNLEPFLRAPVTTWV